MIGQTVSHFRILAKLGEGGMGMVFEAEDTRLQRIVALKFLPAALTSDPQAKARLIREARAASALDHPNICNIHEIDESNGRVFIAMARYKGETLKQKIAGGRLEPGEALRIAEQIAQGLSVAHAHGIVHRDIKPANVFITEAGLTKILDFGVVKLVDQTGLTGDGALIGTAGYMSPEQIREEVIDHRADIWAVGVLLYEMLTGQRPFIGDSVTAVIYSILQREPESIISRSPLAPPPVERIVARTLEKEPSKRYQRTEELLRELQDLQEISSTGSRSAAQIPDYGMTRSTARGGGATPGARRWKFVAALAGAAAMIVLVVWLVFFRGAAGAQPTSVAVLGFENVTGETSYDYLEQAIPDLLITSLEQCGALRVSTRERLHDLLRQAGVEGTETISREVGFELCILDNVQAVVVGSFTRAGDVFATEVKILDVHSKELLGSSKARGSGVASILETQIDELSLGISRGMGVRGCSINEANPTVAGVTTPFIEAYAEFSRGKLAYERMYLADARDHLKSAVAADPGFATAHLYLAWVYQLMGSGDGPRTAIENAIHHIDRASKKEQLYIEATHARLIETDLASETRVLEELVERYPKEKFALRLLSVNYRRQRQYERALETLKRSIALDPAYAPAVNSLAYTYSDMRDFDQALQTLERYIAIVPEDANPHDSMADLHFRMGNARRAIASFERALELRPDFEPTLAKIWYVHAILEEYSASLRWVERSVASVPPSGGIEHAYRRRAFCEYWGGRRARAREYLQLSAGISAAEDMWGASCLAELAFGWFDLDEGNIVSGRRHMDTWLEAELTYANESRTAFLRSLHALHAGLADLEQKDLASARQRLAEMERLADGVEPIYELSTEFTRHLLGAEIELAAGAPEAALEAQSFIISFDFERLHSVPLIVLNLSRKNVLARAHLARGDTALAITEYERLVDADPNRRGRLLVDARDHFQLAWLYEQTGRPDEAVAEYTAFLGVWDGADSGIEEVEEGRRRLESLRGTL